MTQSGVSVFIIIPFVLQKIQESVTCGRHFFMIISKV